MNYELLIKRQFAGLAEPHLVKSFCGSIRKTKRTLAFDSTLYDMMKKYAADPLLLEEVRGYINSVKFDKIVGEYDQLEEQFEKFSGTNHPPFSWNENFKKAKAFLRSRLDVNLNRGRKLYRTRTDLFNDEQLKSLFKVRGTHSGFEYLMTGMRSKDELFKNGYSLEFQRRLPLWLEQGHVGYPILPGTRLQPKGVFSNGEEAVKLRLIGMVSTGQVLLEKQYADPFQHLLAQSGLYAGIPEHQIASIVRQRGFVAHATSIDYSSFDQTISDWLIHEAFDLIFESFQESDRNTKMERTIRNSFIKKSYIDGHGDLVYSEKGVPSGSAFTQIVGSLVNCLVVFTYLAKMKVLETSHVIAMGDDNLIHTMDELDAEDMSSYIKKNFGLIVNPDETSQYKPREFPEFLSRVWHDYFASRDPKMIYFKMILAEKFRPYSQGKAVPEGIIASYHTTYRANVLKWLKLSDFQKDFPRYADPSTASFRNSKFLTGAMAYRINYLE